MTGDNVTVTGNSTISGLTNGLHNITVYAIDAYGTSGASATITFTVEVPFPTSLVAAASVTSVGVIAAGLVFYFRKRKN